MAYVNVTKHTTSFINSILIFLFQIPGLHSIIRTSEINTSDSFKTIADFISNKQLVCSIPDDHVLQPYLLQVANGKQLSDLALPFIPITTECHYCSHTENTNCYIRVR